MLTNGWKGGRGEWYVVAQAVLFLLIVFGPRAGSEVWFAPYSTFSTLVGAGLVTAGGLLTLAGVFGLGRNLTALPRPRENARLVQSGPYRIVRHPIYSGLIMMVWGWAACNQDWLLIVYAVVTLVFFDLKSRREERWLKERFPEYAAYQSRVRKLIPFVY